MLMTQWNKENQLFIDKISISKEALDILSKKYHVTFRIINDELQNSRFTGTIKNQGVEQIIKNLSISCRFNYRIVKNNSPENDGTRATIELY